MSSVNLLSIRLPSAYTVSQTTALVSSLSRILDTRREPLIQCGMASGTTGLTATTGAVNTRLVNASLLVPRVIRLNPDAIIYDESRLKGLMAQPSLHGIFSNCLRVDCSHNFVLMTDFLVFRPREANYDKWFEEKINHAEEWCSSVFGDMARSDRAGWIQRISHHPSCRIAQEDIGHTHEKWTVKLDYIIDGRTSCPAANYDPCDPD